MFYISYLPCNITILPFSPVLHGRAPKAVLKYTAKVAAAAKSAGMADCCDCFLSLGQHAACLLEPVIPQIFQRRGVQAFTEGTEAFALTDKSSRGDFLDRNFFPEMFMDIYEH